jgi:hypothetical protein
MGYSIVFYGETNTVRDCQSQIFQAVLPIAKNVLYVSA